MNVCMHLLHMYIILHVCTYMYVECVSVFSLEKSLSVHKTTPLINYITTFFTSPYFASSITLIL